MVGAIIVAAGNSNRMNGINKILIDVAGMSIIARTIKNFEDCKIVDYIIIVTRNDMKNSIENEIQKYNFKKILNIVEGGINRQESVRNGIIVCPQDTDIIAIHDGARPMVEPILIENVIKDCEKYSASILGVPIKETIKLTDNNFVINTPQRDKIYIAQTPQVFDFKIYKEAMNIAFQKKLLFTDDCQMLENIGKKVHITKGNYKNIKITTVEDIEVIKHYLL